MMFSSTLLTFPLFAAILIVAGCTDGIGSSDKDRNIRRDSTFIQVTQFDCGHNNRLTIGWKKDVVQVSYDGNTWFLPRALSASGARYSDGKREIWDHQGKLRWKDAGVNPRICSKL